MGKGRVRRAEGDERFDPGDPRRKEVLVEPRAVPGERHVPRGHDTRPLQPERCEVAVGEGGGALVADADGHLAAEAAAGSATEAEDNERASLRVMRVI